MLPVREQMAKSGREMDPSNCFRFQCEWVSCQNGKIMHRNANRGTTNSAQDGTKEGWKGLSHGVMKIQAALAEWESSKSPAVCGQLWCVGKSGKEATGGGSDRFDKRGRAAN